MKTKGGELADDSLLRGSGTMMIVPPLTSSHTLSHEQVMPFLKKLEQGQLREGVCVCVCVCVCACVRASVRVCCCTMLFSTFPDILKVLQDLEETSLHSVDILKHFVVRV